MTTLSIPKGNDPLARSFARLSLLGCLVFIIGLAFLSNIARPELASAQADPDPIIITATPALPITPVPDIGAAVPTATPLGWLDQQLAAAADVGNALAQEQADQLTQEQAAAQAEAARLAAEQLAREQYLSNIGAQAPHSPRGDVQEPPPSQTGPILYPANGSDSAYIVAPAAPPAQAPAQPAIAVAVPQLSADQAAVLAERESHGCAVGQVFYPRTGCHTPGSGGDMPGAVGD